MTPKQNLTAHQIFLVPAGRAMAETPTTIGPTWYSDDYMSPLKYFGNESGRTSGRPPPPITVVVSSPRRAARPVSCSGDKAAAWPRRDHCAGRAARSPCACSDHGITGPWRDRSLAEARRRRPEAGPLLVCAARGLETSRLPAARPRSGRDLPVGGSAARAAAARPRGRLSGQPGLGHCGHVGHARLTVPLSNESTGNRFGTVTYRVTLRDPNGTDPAHVEPVQAHLAPLRP